MSRIISITDTFTITAPTTREAILVWDAVIGKGSATIRAKNLNIKICPEAAKAKKKAKAK